MGSEMCIRDSRRSVCWKEVDEVTDFPQLDEEQLRELTCGSYQLRLAPRYTHEHINGECSIYVHNEDQGPLRIRMQSRHISSKPYQLWIKYEVSLHGTVSVERVPELPACALMWPPLCGSLVMQGITE